MIETSKEDLKHAQAQTKKTDEKKADDRIEPLAPEITVDDFAKIDLRVGTIVETEEVKEAKKLLKLKVDIGFETRQVFAGLNQAYPDAKSLIGRKVVLVANLKPRQMKFGLSEDMVTAAGPVTTEVFLLCVDSGAQNGDRIH